MLKKLLQITTGLFLAVIVFTGCMKGEIALDVKRDGSGRLTYKILAQPYMQKQIKEEMEKLKEKGMTVNAINEEGKGGFTAVKELDNFYELDRFLLFNSYENIIDNSRQEKGFFYNEQIFDILYRGPKNEPKMTAEQKKQRDAILSSLDFVFALNLPEAPLTQNAEQIADNGKKLTWKIKMVSDTHMTATVKVWNWVNIIIFAIAAVVVMTGIWCSGRAMQMPRRDRL